MVFLLKFGAVVLAVGKSERKGQSKLLLPLNGKTLIETILDALAAAGVNEPIVVLGKEPGEIIEAIRQQLGKVKIALNLADEEGTISSFQTGLMVLSNVDAAFLILGDQPILDPKIIIQMREIMEISKDNPLIVSPVHCGKKGHPLLFSRQLFGELLSLKTSQTIGDIVHEHVDKMITFEAPEWTIMDVYEPQDYDRIVRLAKA